MHLNVAGESYCFSTQSFQGIAFYTCTCYGRLCMYTYLYHNI